MLSKDFVKTGIVDDIPELLYHYTNDCGLKGILKDNLLFATHYKVLNDAKERELFFDLLSSQLNLSEFTRDDLSSAKISEVLSSTISKVVGDNLFTTSFCFHDHEYEIENGLLSQWVYYGKNGYALIFDKKKMLELIELENEEFKYAYQSVFMTKCLYDYSEELEGLDKVIELSKALLKCKLEIVTEDDLSSQIRECYRTLIELISKVKHFAFRKEQEVRIVALLNPNWHKNDELKEIKKNDRGKRYLELFGSRKKLPIKKIIIGPGECEEQNKKEKEVRSLLSKYYSFNDVEIKRSSTPFIDR